MYGYLIIKPDNSVELVESDSYKFTVGELQKAVDCDMISIVRVHGPGCLYLCCDDNFIAKEKDFNLIATCLYGGYMAGNVVLGCTEVFYPDEDADIYKISIGNVKLYKKTLEELDLVSLCDADK